MTKRKCTYCEKTIFKSLSDFADIGWSAFSFDGKKAVCACPEHSEKLEKDIHDIFDRSVGGN